MSAPAPQRPFLTIKETASRLGVDDPGPGLALHPVSGHVLCLRCAAGTPAPLPNRPARRYGLIWRMRTASTTIRRLITTAGCAALRHAPGQAAGRREKYSAQGAGVTPDALTYAAAVRIVREAPVHDKSYRKFPLGGEVGRFLRALRVEGKRPNTLRSYESVLQKLVLDHADLELHDFEPPRGNDLLLDFLDRRWGDSDVNTLRHRAFVLRSFFDWARRTKRIREDPTEAIRTPRQRRRERYVPAQSDLEHLDEPAVFARPGGVPWQGRQDRDDAVRRVRGPPRRALPAHLRRAAWGG